MRGSKRTRTAGHPTQIWLALSVAAALAGCGKSAGDDDAAGGSGASAGTGGSTGGGAGKGSGGNAGKGSGGTGGSAGKGSSGGAGSGGTGGSGETGGGAGTGGNGGSGGAGASSGTGGEAGAPMSGCPTEPPTNGDPCQEPGTSCEWGTCPGDGELTYAICVRTAWSVSDVVCNLDCCTRDADCSGTKCVSGQCRAAPAAGCYRDDDCAEGERCSAAWVCPCGYDCEGFDRTGSCVPDGLDCCLSDEDCDGGLCVRGVCKLPVEDACWSDAECGLDTCEGENVCACGMACLVADSPGQCRSL